MCEWRACLTSIRKWFVMDSDESDADRYSLDQMVREACDELKQAHDLLDRVHEPDMVEYAVYSLKAAEKRYDYLIKQIREQRKACCP